MITFDEKLEAAWGLHKIEKAVLEKEIAELRADNEKLREENIEWQKMTEKFILINDEYKEQIEYWMKEANEQKVLHKKARELGTAEGRLVEIQQQTLMQTNIKSSN